MRDREPLVDMKERGIAWQRPRAYEDIEIPKNSAVGVVLGGRIGYVLFYHFNVYAHDPFAILRVWEGGMSFHGGLVGVITAMAFFSYSRKLNFLAVSDAVAVATPCCPAPVSAMMRFVPMRRATMIWPSTLLTLCEPVWLSSSRLK